jgi:hypothetical protein
MSEWQPLEAGTVVRDRYEVEALLGKGGFGATYRARDRERFDQPCALKELLPAKATNPKVLGLFEREARILLALRHPGIPSLHAYFTESGRYYLVQDFVAGATLAQLVQKHGNSAPAILMQRGLDVGLAAAFQVIFRGLSSAVSHLGYSGIFGYYVGLAALRPEHKWRLLLRGFLTAAIVHATWNATNEVGGGIVVPPLAFALLITSIIKARSMSPGRDANFATTLGR